MGLLPSVFSVSRPAGFCVTTGRFLYGVPGIPLKVRVPRCPLMWCAAIIGDTEGARALGRATEEHSQRNDKHADLLERGRAKVQGG